MEPSKSTARTAGLLYMIVVLTGIFSLAYVPSVLISWEDAAETFTRIKASETLFRLSIVAGMVCYTAFLLLPFMLYKLLSGVNATYAVAMVILSVVSVPFSLYNLINKVNVLTLIKNESIMGVDQIQQQVMLSLRYYNNGISVVSVFWGLWLLPFGYLVYKSGFLPKLFGILLMTGCIGYLVNFIGGFLFEHYSSLGISGYVSLPASLGEIGICLWLLIVGVKPKPSIS